MAGLNEVREKERRVREYLNAQGLGAVLLSKLGNVAWFTGGGDAHVAVSSEYGVASALITAQEKFIISDNIERARIAEEEVRGQGFTLLSYPWQDAAARVRLIREAVGPVRCAADDGTPGTIPLAAAFDELRFSLTEPEVDRFKKLGADCGQLLAAVTGAIRPGETEGSVAGRLSAACFDRGILPVVTLVAADERIAQYRHPIPKSKKVRRCVMVVLCGRRQGLICSATRLAHFGPLPEELRQKHEVCTLVDATLIARTRVGAPIGEVLQAGLRAYAEGGFGAEWNLHHQGGPAGYFPRDFKAVPEERRTVQLNQAFAWNPSITGTKSEDTILALKGGPLVISQTGEWPTVTHRVDGVTLSRPDILVL